MKKQIPNPTENLPGWAEYHVQRLCNLKSFRCFRSRSMACDRGARQGRRRSIRKLYTDLHEFDPLSRDRTIRDILDMVELHLNAEEQ